MQKELAAPEVGAAAAFLVSPLASAITGSTVYVDNGLNNMALVGLRPSCKVLLLNSCSCCTGSVTFDLGRSQWPDMLTLVCARRLWTQSPW
jgi:Enoyl-(Acyl carrier protein) reductase